MPHGVTPPEQLFCVPRTLRPLGSADGLQVLRAGGRAADLEDRVERDPAAVPARHDLEAAVDRVAAGQQHREAVRRPGDLHLLLGRVRRVVLAGREHVDLGRVLVVDHEQVGQAQRVLRDQADEVVVVAELLGLRGRGLLGEVELRGARDDRVAPADDDALGVAVRDGDLVELVRRDRRRSRCRAPAAGGLGSGGRRRRPSPTGRRTRPPRRPSRHRP